MVNQSPTVAMLRAEQFPKRIQPMTVPTKHHKNQPRGTRSYEAQNASSTQSSRDVTREAGRSDAALH